ncbi:hypothetical protein HOLleu_31244 [Holothuria leucospilota]|uniref:Uncharacterized protein n=1 Tax=Holothuria leucospilota TaxID=206669 RepID=A0A9Q0YS13_HOLLE|nr:hypothetical protein HOLleu_31244 [Holothuria leucospilota]
MEFEKYVNLGREIGLSGQELLDFAQNRETIEKKERAKSEKEAREDRERVRKHVMEMKELELRLREAQVARGTQEPEISLSRRVKLPQLSPFQDGRDEIDDYLSRFQTFATAAGWPESQWASLLSTLLTGRALAVYAAIYAGCRVM